MPPDPSVTRLRSCRFFHALSNDAAQRLARSATPLRLRNAERLWNLGDPARAFGLIERGLVLISVPHVDGSISSLGLFGPRECVGLSAALNDNACYPADAVVLTPTLEVLMVSASTTREVIAVDSSCAAAIQGALLDHTDALRAEIEILSAGKVSSRLASLLTHLAHRFGDEHDGETFIPVPLSRPTLAQLVSARPETVVRTLTAWRKEDLVLADAEGFRVTDLARLVELATGH